MMRALRVAMKAFEIELIAESDVSLVHPTEWESELSMLSPDVLMAIQDAADEVPAGVPFAFSLQRARSPVPDSPQH
jgi:hypothetical protein